MWWIGLIVALVVALIFAGTAVYVVRNRKKGGCGGCPGCGSGKNVACPHAAKQNPKDDNQNPPE